MLQVMVARTSFLFRGMGSVVDKQIQTAKKWRKHAVQALKEVGEDADGF